MAEVVRLLQYLDGRGRQHHWTDGLSVKGPGLFFLLVGAGLTGAAGCGYFSGLFGGPAAEELSMPDQDVHLKLWE